MLVCHRLTGYHSLPTYPLSSAHSAPSFCWHSRHLISCVRRPRRRLQSDDSGIRFCSDETEMRKRSTLIHPGAMARDSDSLAHSFSRAATELKHRAHWHETAGRLRWEVSIVSKHSASSVDRWQERRKDPASGVQRIWTAESAGPWG